ncbi:MAG: thioredoxin domain-containing protein [Bacteroidales bacterium]|nr:thioredoxin domain-containing protein [Bacteroidales bacterium]
MPAPKYTNPLIHETSPYLLQHAHNPVDWHAWNESTLAKARSYGKMLLISIGYSSCHWCHVMEKESFEDEEVAKIMNKHFICIKVDREERPDVDQVYMNAVQLITGSGGWPLNCFALPDGRPFFGGTYFRRSQWMQLMENISLLFINQRKDLEEQAESLTNGVKAGEVVKWNGDKGPVNKDDLILAATLLGKQFDLKEGGLGGAPKFPMPATLAFLLRHSSISGNTHGRDFVKLTLRKMAFGGIYDQIGGGFARYSTDAQWKVPHFEKMLYDNAQLVSLYAEAYQAYGDHLYKETADETIQFVFRELTSPDGGFYSSLDADSEGEEGKYYTWGTAEMNQILGNHADLVKKYYQIGGKGFWETGQNILLRTQSPEEFAKAQGFQPSAFKTILKPARAKLLKARSKRIRPGLDNKILTSWNGLMLKGLADAYRIFGKQEYLDAAMCNAQFMMGKVMGSDGRLFHSYNQDKAAINGFLEDYCFLAEGLLSLYQVTFDENYLQTARKLVDYAIEHFLDRDSGLLFVTSSLDPPLIARKHEIYDNVIPSSNSSMAGTLQLLGLVFEKEDYLEMSTRMISGMKDHVKKYPSAFANWASVMLKLAHPFYTVVVTGPEYLEKIVAMSKIYNPQVFFCGSKTGSGLPIFKDRLVEGETMIYVCTGRECKLPTSSVEEALKCFSQIADIS